MMLTSDRPLNLLQRWKGLLGILRNRTVDRGDQVTLNPTPMKEISEGVHEGGHDRIWQQVHGRVIGQVHTQAIGQIHTQAIRHVHEQALWQIYDEVNVGVYHSIQENLKG